MDDTTRTMTVRTMFGIPRLDYPTTMSEIFYKSAAEIADLIRRKQVSPTEVLDAHIARIEAVNPRLNALVTLSLDQARDAARASEARIAKGEALGPLEGVPVSVKDTIETAGIRT